jgi:hypothetical protein
MVNGLFNEDSEVWRSLESESHRVTLRKLAGDVRNALVLFLKKNSANGG